MCSQGGQCSLGSGSLSACLSDLTHLSPRSGVVPFSTSEVRDRLDIWAIQQSLFERLQGAHGTQERIAAATLRDSNSLDASSLYNDFAVRFRAFDICLELLGTCGLHEEREICACWEQLLSLPTLVSAGLCTRPRTLSAPLFSLTPPSFSSSLPLVQKSSSDLIQARRVLCDQAPPLLARYPHVVPLSWLCGELEAHAADSSDLGGRWLVDSLWRVRLQGGKVAHSHSPLSPSCPLHSSPLQITDRALCAPTSPTRARGPSARCCPSTTWRR